MTVTLSPEQEAWLKAQVSNGVFCSVEDAVRQLIDERIVLRATELDDDLAWAAPLVAEAETAVAAGKVITLEEHEELYKNRIASLKKT